MHQGYKLNQDWLNENGLDASDPIEAAGLLQEAGIVVRRRVIATDDVSSLRSALEVQLELVEKALARKQVDPETFAYAECAGRGKNRLDIRWSSKEGLDASLMQGIAEAVYDAIGGANILQEEKAHIIGTGAVVSSPGAEVQRWHRDGPMLFPETGNCSLPAHAVTAFLALGQSGVLEGATQFLPGSHMGPGERFIEPMDNPYAEPQLSSGDVVAFDYRLIHRGGRNTTANTKRSLIYFVFGRHWFSDTLNYLNGTSLPKLLAVDVDEGIDDSVEISAILCLETDAHYSERALATTPSGTLPKAFSAVEKTNISFFPIRFEDLVGTPALRALEIAAGFSYMRTIAFLRKSDLRDRQLLQRAPAPSAQELGIADFLNRRYIAPLAIKRVGEIDGFGLFSDTELPPESFLCEYAGLVRPEDTTHGWDAYSLHYANSLDGSLPLKLSAQHMGSLARFANHDDLNPNARFVRCVSDSGLLRIVLMTLRHLAKGDQILVDYGKAYWQGAALSKNTENKKIHSEPIRLSAGANVLHMKNSTYSQSNKTRSVAADTIRDMKSSAMLRLAGIAASVRLAVDDVLLVSTDDGDLGLKEAARGDLTAAAATVTTLPLQRTGEEEDALAAWRELDTW